MAKSRPCAPPGVPGRRVVPPILAFGFLAMCAAAASSLVAHALVDPRRVIWCSTSSIASELTADVQPRCVRRTVPQYDSLRERRERCVGRLRRPLAQDISGRRHAAGRTAPPTTRSAAKAPKSPWPRKRWPCPTLRNNRIQLALRNESTYVAGKEIKDYSIDDSATGDETLQAQRPDEEARMQHPVTEMDTRPLYRLAYRTPGADKLDVLQARIELQQAFRLSAGVRSAGAGGRFLSASPRGAQANPPR